MSIIRLIIIIFFLILSQRCSTNLKNEPNIQIKTIFSENKQVDIFVSTIPYEPKISTINSMQSFFKDSLGLQTKINQIDLGISSKSELSEKELLDTSQKVLKDVKSPTIIIVTSKGMKDFQGYGRIYSRQTSCENGEKYPIAIVVLIRKDFLAKNYEWIVLKHELGHWVGVPQRPYHIYKNKRHCTNLRCVMISGPKLRWSCGVGLSVLFLSPPDFCNDCKAELEEIKKLHETKN